VIGALLIMLVLEATRLPFGWLMPLLAAMVVVYPFFGSMLPEPFHTTSYGLKRTISNLSVSLNNGIYGAVLPISANFIFLFVVFGGVLQATGATRFFMELGKLAGRRLQGGPGLMAVASSAAVGSVTGNIAANIAITGSFTIPLMKKSGYTPEQAGAIEAAASNGGQIMPPVMGIVAFGMAGMTGIPYVRIIAMALVPALLYFFSIGTYVQLNARKLGLESCGEKVDVKAMLSTAPQVLAPLGVIVAMLVKGHTVWYVAFWAIVSAVLASIAVCVITGKKIPPVSVYIEGFVTGAKSGAKIAAMSCCIGLIMATITLSGLGVKLSSGIEMWSGGRLLPALLIVGGIYVFIGMGGPSLTAYIIASIFAVPALTGMGVGFEQAHFFTMFTTIFAYLTPPVAIGAMIAARLAGGGYTRTALEAVYAAAAGVVAGIVMIFALQVALVGQYLTKCRLLDRALALLSFALFLCFFPLQNYVLFAFGGIVFIILTFLQFKAVRRGPVYSSPDNAGV